MGIKMVLEVSLGADRPPQMMQQTLLVSIVCCTSRSAACPGADSVHRQPAP